MWKINLSGAIFTLSIAFSFYHLTSQFLIGDFLSSSAKNTSVSPTPSLIAEVKNAELSINKAIEDYKVDTAELKLNIEKLDESNASKDKSSPETARLVEQIAEQQAELKQRKQEIMFLQAQLNQLYKFGFDTLSQDFVSLKSGSASQDDGHGLLLGILGLIVAVISAIPAWIQLYEYRTKVSTS